MSRFYWRETEEFNLFERFRNVRGREEWRHFLEQLLRFISRTDVARHEIYGELHQLFDGYVRSLDDAQRKSSVKECCVFISHKRCDVQFASRIAWIAVREGFDYWLDVEDPVLPAIAGASMPSPLKEILVAAIVEIALLNATHLIAVHTPQSHRSMWVPYELGRAKSRDIWSSQVSGWFEPGQTPIAGEYTYLMERLQSRLDIERWLRSQPVNRPGYCSRPKLGKIWPGSEPPPLQGEADASS